MNLFELYVEKPSNYFICADVSKQQFAGGIGKTSQMQYLAHEICGSEVQGRVVIPILIKMSEWNTKHVDSDTLYQYVIVHFHNQTTKKIVLEMIQKSQEYCFLFLLDGINEVNNYVLVSGQTVYDCLINNIRELIRYENVHFIITSRMEHEIMMDEGLKELFIQKELCALEHQQYKEYLQMEAEKVIPEPLVKICENAMLLQMFKYVYEMDKERALSLKSRYDLMKQYFKLDTEYKKNPEWNDHLSRVRTHLIDNILPYIAFKVVAANLQEENHLTNMEYDLLLRESMQECETPQSMNRKLIEEVLRMTGLLDCNLIFQHDMIRDYFAVQGLEKQWEYSKSRGRVQKFMKDLHENMKYDSSRGMDYNRRTRYMDFCEFLYASRQDRVQSLLKKCNLKEASLETAFLFYCDLTGLYKDLIQSELAEELGSIALSLLEQLENEGTYSEFELANFYNYLGYSIATKEAAIHYLKHAKTILEHVEELSKKEKRLMGRILSNIGAYYYARKDYEAAIIWHKKAIEYRIEKQLWEDMIHSYRTLMSDYYMLKKYVQAYECYLQGVKYLGEDVVDLEFEERAMGSEIALLSSFEVTEEKRTELLQRLTKQIEVIFEGATSAYRKNMNLLENLYRKLNQLEEILLQNQDSNVYDIVMKYREKCESILKG